MVLFTPLLSKWQLHLQLLTSALILPKRMRPRNFDVTFGLSELDDLFCFPRNWGSFVEELFPSVLTLHGIRVPFLENLRRCGKNSTEVG